MATTITAGNATNGAAISSDNTGILELKTGTGSGTTAVTIGTDQSVTFAGAVSTTGNQTLTGNLTVNGNTTLGDSSSDTILMTAAPSIGGAGLGMGFGFRNRIINGAMVIAQRGTAAVTSSSGAQFPVDRFFIIKDTATTAVMTAQQDSSAPAGFINSVKITTTTAQAVLAATDYHRFAQQIEGFNAADLGWGTANAQSVTLSFWVRSSLTGTFGGSLGNSAWNRTYPFTYTISAANTWEQKSITIAGDTSGTWLSNNGIGLRVDFGLGVGTTYSGTAGAWAGALYISATGATNVSGTLNATWYITGVQLEKGSTATSFDVRPYGTELQLCQRYYQKVGATDAGDGVAMATAFNTTDIYGVYNFKVTMRTDPTGSASSSGALEYLSNGGAQVSTAIVFQLASPNQIEISTTQSSRGAGDAGWWRFPSATNWIAFSAEL